MSTSILTLPSRNCSGPDFAFKKLFGTEMNKDLLISFLNALLQGHEEITDLTYLNTEQLGTAETERKAVFDVYCQTVTGERILIEMQKAEQQFFKDRSIFYSTFPIRDQAQKGNWDYSLSRVYTIGVLNFVRRCRPVVFPSRSKAHGYADA